MNVKNMFLHNKEKEISRAEEWYVCAAGRSLRNTMAPISEHAVDWLVMSLNINIENSSLVIWESLKISRQENTPLAIRWHSNWMRWHKNVSVHLVTTEIFLLKIMPSVIFPHLFSTDLMSFDELSSAPEKLFHPTANRPKMPGRRLPAQFGGGHSVSTHTV